MSEPSHHCIFARGTRARKALASLRSKCSLTANTWAAAGIILIGAAAGARAQSDGKFRVLLYDINPPGSYVHTASIAAFKDSITAWSKAFGFTLDIAADANVFTPANLAKYKTVVMDNVSSEVAPGLPQASQRSALIDYIKTNGFFANHATVEASQWPDLYNLVGANMANHTDENNLASATLNVDPGAVNNPVVTGVSATGSKLPLDAKVSLHDEWYTYKTNPRGLSGMQILYTLDEKTFTPAGSMGSDHPIAWYRTQSGGGHTFYMGMGHAASCWTQPFVRSMAINALFATAGLDVSVAVRPRPSLMHRAPVEAPAALILRSLDGRLVLGPGDEALRPLSGAYISADDRGNAQRLLLEGIKP